MIIGPQGIASVYRRRSAPHVDSESNRLDDLFAGGSMLMGHLGVVSNAAFAVNRDFNCDDVVSGVGLLRQGAPDTAKAFATLSLSQTATCHCR